MLFMWACLLSFITLSNFSEEVSSLPSSIIFFSLENVRISFFNFLIKPCLFFVAMSESLCSSSFNFYLNQSLVSLVVHVTSPQAENVDNVAFHLNFWPNFWKNVWWRAIFEITSDWLWQIIYLAPGIYSFSFDVIINAYV